MNKRIVVHVGWCKKNYDGGWGDPECGIIISTGRTLDDFKQDFKEALDFHIESMAEDKDTFPEWMANGQYEIEYYLHTSALLHEAERFTTLTAISRASGISKKVLQAYATSEREARPQQRERIIKALNTIGQEVLALSQLP